MGGRKQDRDKKKSWNKTKSYLFLSVKLGRWANLSPCDICRCSVQPASISLPAWRMTITPILSLIGRVSADCTLCLSLPPLSQVWLCSLMIWLLYADSSHLPLRGTVTVIAISVQKAIGCLCLFQGSLCGQLWSGRHNAWGVAVCVSVLEAVNTFLSASHTDKANCPAASQGTGAPPERSEAHEWNSNKVVLFSVQRWTDEVALL